MFDRILGKFRKSSGSAESEKSSSAEEPRESVRPEDAALLAAIEEQKKNDPLIGAKIGGKEILDRLLTVLKDEKGVHAESLFCALGSLAGYACQANLRAQAISKGMDPNAPFIVVKAGDGKPYYFGDPLNQCLAESKFSVWSLSAGAAQHAGAKTLPDINEIFEHSTNALGSEQFGIPRYPTENKAGDLPINYVKALWPLLLPIVKKLEQNPMLWPLLCAFAIQDAIEMTKGTISPEHALSIVMESAIPMSKVDLDSF